MHFENNRQAAAYLIRMGRSLLAADIPLSEFVSRSDNNRRFSDGWNLIETGRRVAIGYEHTAFTHETYLAHKRATSPVRNRSVTT